MRTKLTKLLSLLVLLATTSCHELFDLLDELHSEEPKVIEYASGLNTPFGLELDPEGNVWVAEAGSGNSDGRISVITDQDEVYPVIEGFSSVVADEEPTPIGVSHMVLQDHTLWILNIVEGRLYWADVSSFQPGDTPMQASELEFQDIATFVLEYDFGDADTGESNPYNLTIGPEGNLYITDAAANAIIRREAGTGALSVFALIPSIDNPTEIGPPVIHAVPTGIAFNGHKFFVSTLTGFPFPKKEALIYAVDLEGNVAVYDKGFTTLVDIILDPDKKPVVLQFAKFEQGFAPMTGRVVRSEENEVILDKLNYPLGIRRKGLKTYYVTSAADGTVTKLAF